MTDAAEILARAHAIHGPPAPRVSSAPPDEPRANSPEDVGYAPRQTKPRPKSQTDREFLAALPGGAFEGVEATGDAVFGPWCVTLRRKNGKRRWVYGASEADALRNARALTEREEGE